jgi:hypothetical protein
MLKKLGFGTFVCMGPDLTIIGSLNLYVEDRYQEILSGLWTYKGHKGVSY